MKRATQRRAVLAGVLGLLVSSLRAQGPAKAPAAAQPAGKVRRIGYLSFGSPVTHAHLLDAFRQGMRDQGYEDGRNVAIQYRFAEGRPDRLAGLAAELVRLEVDLIVAVPTAAAVAAARATASIPTVMISVADPVRLGLVASLARPGGNRTGVSFSVGLESLTKGLQVLREAVPGAGRVAVLSNPGNPAQVMAVEDMQAAARSLGLQLQLLTAGRPEEFEPGFAAMARERAGALLVVADTLFIQHRAQLAELAARHRLPSMYGVRENVEAGGLLSYGPDLADQARRGATYVARILTGAKPADLPVEQPTKFELVVNLKTAKALGLAIPRSLLLRADEVIE